MSSLQRRNYSSIRGRIHKYAHTYSRTCTQAPAYDITASFDIAHSVSSGSDIYWSLLRQVPKLSTDLDLILLCIFRLGTYSKFVWRNKIPSLGVCLPQPYSTFGFPHIDHVLITTDLLVRFHKNQFDEIL